MLEKYLSIEKNDGVAVIWLDQQDEKINKVSPDLIGLFGEVVDQIEKDASIKCAVLISRKKDFVAGADIESFQKVEKPGDFEPITRKGHAILNRIANSKKPVVAAIHGACLGAGLEIALACHARMATDHRSTKLGLPEVKLGLLPGGGGTQRLPRLVGLQKALDMMLTGKNIYAHKAKKMGLVDELVNHNKLHRSAVLLAKKLVKKPLERKDKRAFMEKFLEGNPITRGIIFKKAREMVHRMTQGNYPALPEIITCIETGYKKGMKAGLDEEAKRFEKLILSPESAQLINIFFATTEKKKNPFPDQVKPLETIGMLGAGFMGAGIAEVSMNNGMDVLLKDIKDETLTEAYQTIWKSLWKKVKRKVIPKYEAESLIGRVRGQLDYEDFDTVDIVIEAVFEDLGLKHRVLAETEAVTREDCIFASNTSALPIGAIAEKSKRPETIIGLHYFSPVPKMPLLEIIVTDKTADWVTASSYDLGVRQGKTCIVVKDGPGFYTTRILAPYLNEALLILEEGAPIEQIDKELKQFGYPVGPIKLLDEVGLDVGAHIMSGDLVEAYVKTREGARISDLVKSMYDAGYHGRKNHKGFYLYDPKTGKRIRGKVNTGAYSLMGGTSRTALPSEDVQLRPAMMMVNEAALCLQEGVISSPLDGDIGAIFGLGFPPFRGGPFRYVDHEGADKIVEKMEALAAKFGPRFKPVEILKEYAREGKRFY